jgi:DNA mismatch repair protein MutL
MQNQIFLLDVFLCQEMVVLSQLEDDFAKQGIRRRPLLVPLTMSVSIEEGNLVESKVSIFESFGMKIERVAPDSLLIREIPLLFEYADITKLIDDMIQLIKSGQSNGQILSMMSGHVNDAGSINIDDKLVTQLLTELKVASMTSAKNLKNSAWRILDGEILSNLLKRKC